jgi:hypothetical protein
MDRPRTAAELLGAVGDASCREIAGFARSGRNAEVRDAALHLLRAAASELGVFAASPLPLHRAAERGEIGPAALPGIELELVADDELRTAFDRARRGKALLSGRVDARRAGPGLARLLLAATGAGYRGPLPVAATVPPDVSVGSARRLIRGALAAGCGRIDLHDGPALADLAAYVRNRPGGDGLVLGCWTAPDAAPSRLEDLALDLHERRKSPRGPDVLVCRAGTRVSLAKFDLRGVSVPAPARGSIRKRPRDGVEVRLHRAPTREELGLLGVAGLAPFAARRLVPLPNPVPAPLAKALDATRPGR